MNIFIFLRQLLTMKERRNIFFDISIKFKICNIHWSSNGTSVRHLFHHWWLKNFIRKLLNDLLQWIKITQIVMGITNVWKEQKMLKLVGSCALKHHEPNFIFTICGWKIPFESLHKKRRSICKK